MADRSDVFGTFLETLEHAERGERKRDDSSLRVMKALVKSGPQSVGELRESAKLPLLAFAEILKELQAAGFITVKDVMGEEVAEVTEHGSRVASIR